MVVLKPANAVYPKASPTHEKLGWKKIISATFFCISYLLLCGLGWPWAVMFAGFNTIVTFFITRPRLVYREDPTILSNRE